MSLSMADGSPFGALLKRHRMEAGLSQEELAERARMSARGIGDLERGVRRSPYRDTIAQLATALDLDEGERAALEQAARRVRKAAPRQAQVTASTGTLTRGNELLLTKLTPPIPRAGLVRRPDLLTRLDAGLHTPLTLVSAPPGSGKTTLLAAWAASVQDRNLSVAWVSLDGGDNDLVRFRRSVLAALDTAGVDVGEDCRSLLQLPHPAPTEVVLTTFLNTINALTTTVVLVLDDYHHIDNETIHRGLAFLLDHLLACLHLVIGTRVDPPLPLARLRARGHITELHLADLRFTRQEASAFLTGVMGLVLTTEEVGVLETRTEGWITGLQLAALSLQGRSRNAISAFITSFAGSHRHVTDYLTDEVLGCLPEPVQSFVLQTSILERLNASLCAALLDEETTAEAVAAHQALLEDLERTNLFLVALEDQRRWYRYHQLFAEALRHRLRQLEPERTVELHLRASRWCERQGLMLDAIEHAFGAGTLERAAVLIGDVSHTLLEQSANEALLRLLDRLPDPAMAHHPTLCVLKAWFLLDQGDLERGEHWLDVAEQALPAQVRSDDALNLQGEIAAARGFAASLRGDAAEVVAHANEALRELDQDNLLTRGMAGLALGRAYMAQGELARAAQSYADAAAVVRRSGNAQAVMRAMFGQSQMERAQGRLHRAMETCRQAIAWSAERGHPYPGVGMMHLALADMVREQNDLDRARRLTAEGLELCRQGRDELDTQLFSRLVLTRIEQASGCLEAAQAIIHEALAMTNGAELPQSVAGWHAHEAQVRLAQGNLAGARACAARAEQAMSQERVMLSPVLFIRGHDHAFVASIQVLVAEAQITGDLGPLQRALTLVEDKRAEADRRGARWLRIKTRVLQSLVHDGLGEPELARTSLKQALELGQPEGYVRVIADEGALVAELLQEIPTDATMRSYVSTLLSAIHRTQLEIDGAV